MLWSSAPQGHCHRMQDLFQNLICTRSKYISVSLGYSEKETSWVLGTAGERQGKSGNTPGTPQSAEVHTIPSTCRFKGCGSHCEMSFNMKYTGEWKRLPFVGLVPKHSMANPLGLFSLEIAASAGRAGSCWIQDATVFPASRMKTTWRKLLPLNL